jgi:hypothetical protein
MQTASRSEKMQEHDSLDNPERIAVLSNMDFSPASPLLDFIFPKL